MNRPSVAWAAGEVPSVADPRWFRALCAAPGPGSAARAASDHSSAPRRKGCQPAGRPRASLSSVGLAASLSWFGAGSQAVTLMFKGLANWYVRVAYQLRNNIPHSKVMSSETNLAVIIFLIKTEVDLLYCKNCSNYFSICFD